MDTNKSGRMTPLLIGAVLILWAADLYLVYLSVPLVGEGIGYWLGFALGQAILPLLLAALFCIGKRFRNGAAGAKVFLFGMVLQMVVNLIAPVLPD
ncbi:hypothetical protein FE236_00425 [Mariprofundus erugo]|uniref:hypothetical protein n=1 Tax=Mariprofundus erugo TaxID=2528639 RepID=UPI0010FDBB03|nr:hypothetical protein [Mariprofundus erugo]TLS78259.1 hypothetical protein FE236_00425 [Mariprofundus erugo]